MFIYVTYGTDGFITAYQNTEADGFTKTQATTQAPLTSG